VEVSKVALPAFNGTVEIAEPLSKKATFPEAAPNAIVTTATMVTFWPKMAGDGTAVNETSVVEMKVAVCSACENCVGPRKN